MTHLKKEWVQLAGLFLGLRCIYSLVGAVAGVGIDPHQINNPIYQAVAATLHYDKFSQLFVNVWFRWDTGWFLKIAAFGYGAQDCSTAFMPLYPWLIRGVSYLTGGNYLLAALLISNLACLLTLILLYEVALREGLLAEAASRAVISFLFLPTAFFLYAAYSESLYFALLLAAWLLAKQRNWLVSGILAALATLCRVQGILLTIILLWMFLVNCANAAGNKPLEQVKRVVGQLTSSKGWQTISAALKRPAWLGVVLPAVSYLSYSLYLRFSGLGSIQGALEKCWGISTVSPWKGFGLFLQRLFTTPRVAIDYIDLALLAAMLVLLLVGLRRIDPALSIYSWLTLATFFMRGAQPHLLESFGRYLLALFPVFLILGNLHSRTLRLGLWMASLGLQIVLLYVFLNFGWVA